MNSKINPCKKTAALYLLLLGLSTPLTSHALNPQIQICNQLNGQYFVANSESDQLGFCRFGQAFIGTLDLLDLHNSKALENYVNETTNCSANGTEETLATPEGDSIEVCHFKGHSFIGLKTLENGKADEGNQQLNTALRIK